METPKYALVGPEVDPKSRKIMEVSISNEPVLTNFSFLKNFSVVCVWETDYRDTNHNPCRKNHCQKIFSAKKKIKRLLFPVQNAQFDYGDLTTWTKRTFSNIIHKLNKKKCLQHPVFGCSHLSTYWRSPSLLIFGERTRTGVFRLVWP